MKQKQYTNNSVSLAGEFAVLSQLALKNYDANMTLGNTKCVDILVSNPKSGKMYQLEVKTKIGRIQGQKNRTFGLTYEWIMHKKHETLKQKNLFYCFVLINKRMVQKGKSNAEEKDLRFFVVPNESVKKYIKVQHRFWLKGKKNRKDNPMRKFRIGLDDKGYTIDTPLAEKYENNWDFK